VRLQATRSPSDKFLPVPMRLSLQVRKAANHSNNPARLWFPLEGRASWTSTFQINSRSFMCATERRCCSEFAPSREGETQLQHSVFVSSTFIDLADHRASVQSVIKQLGAVDVSMENSMPLTEPSLLSRGTRPH
jgi:hypothetical protein